MNIYRYVRFLIKYHLYIFCVAIIMTSISISFLIYKREQIHYGNILRVKLLISNRKDLKKYNHFFSFQCRVFKHMEQQHLNIIEN